MLSAIEFVQVESCVLHSSHQLDMNAHLRCVGSHKRHLKFVKVLLVDEWCQGLDDASFVDTKRGQSIALPPKSTSRTSNFKKSNFLGWREKFWALANTRYTSNTTNYSYCTTEKHTLLSTTKLFMMTGRRHWYVVRQRHFCLSGMTTYLPRPTHQQISFQLLSREEATIVVGPHINVHGCCPQNKGAESILVEVSSIL